MTYNYFAFPNGYWPDTYHPVNYWPGGLIAVDTGGAGLFQLFGAPVRVVPDDDEAIVLLMFAAMRAR